MYIYSPFLRITLSQVTPNILSYIRSSIILDRCLIFAIDSVTIINGALDEILLINIETELNPPAYSTGNRVGIQRWLLSGDWSSQCGLERNF